MKFAYLSLLVATCLVASVHGATVYVDEAASGGNDGSSWTGAFTNLQSALTTATAGDDIWVAAGTYIPDTYFDITNEIRIYGGFPTGGGDGTFAARNADPESNNTILSGDLNRNGDPSWPTPDPANAQHVVRVFPGLTNCVLDGFTITGGYADGTGNAGRGAGIFVNNDAAPLLENLLLTRNDAINDGGGVMVETGGTAIPVFRSVIFRDNSTGDDGAAAFNWDRSPEYIDCQFLNNRAGDAAGAMQSQNSTATLTRCSFSGNHAWERGGALVNLQSSLHIDHCDFQANSVVGFNNVSNTNLDWTGGDAQGGAIYHDGGTLEILGCKFISNQCVGGNGTGTNDTTGILGGGDGTGGYGFGAAIAHVSGSLSAINCLFFLNEARGGTGSGGQGKNFSPNGSGISGSATGGAVYTYSGNELSIINCSFSRNIAIRGSAGGPGTHLIKSSGGGALGVETGTALLANSILWYDQAYTRYPFTSPAISEYGGSIKAESSIIAGAGGPDGATPTGSDPLFVNTGASDLHLQNGSPAIGAGDNSLVPTNVTTDLDGNSRIVPFAVDAGCYETPQLSLSVSDINLGTSTNCTTCGVWLAPATGIETPMTFLGSSGDLTFVREPTILPNGDLDFEITPGSSGSAFFQIQAVDSSGNYASSPPTQFTINNSLQPPSDIPPSASFDFTASNAGPIGKNTAAARVRGYFQPPGTRKGVAILTSGFSSTLPQFPDPQADLTNGTPTLNQFGLSFYAAGFDVYTVDFADPRTYVDSNAMVVAEILQALAGAGLDNGGTTSPDQLSPGEKVILCGESMGGLVCRFALCYLDTLKVPYRCDLFISFDSPQMGAYIPIGLQYFAEWLNRLGGDYSGGFSNADLQSSLAAMDSPAAKQMLLMHHSQADNTGTPAYATDRTTFVNTLRDTYGNWPTNPNLRMVSVINGSGDGLYEEHETTTRNYAIKFNLPKPDGEYRILTWRSDTHEIYNQLQTPSYQDPVLGKTVWKAKFQVRATAYLDATAWAQRISATPITVFSGAPTAFIYVTNKRGTDTSYWDVQDGTLAIDMSQSDSAIRASIRDFIKLQLNLPAIVPDSWIDPVIDAFVSNFDGQITSLKQYTESAKTPSAHLWDWAPGSLRTTAVDVATALGGAGTVSYISNSHCFIPTTSALAISDSVSPDQEAIPNDARLLSPFDDIYDYGTYENTPHLANVGNWITKVLDHEASRLCGNFRVEIRNHPPPFYYSWEGPYSLQSTSNLTSPAWNTQIEGDNGIYRPAAPVNGYRFFRLSFPNTYQ